MKRVKQRRPAGRDFSRDGAGSVSAVRAFSMGDAMPVLDGRDLLDLWECVSAGQYYEPPVPREYLSKCLRANAHHASAIEYKKLQLVRHFEPHPFLSRSEFEGLALDWLVFADMFVERVPNYLGGTARYKRALAKWTRRGVDNLDQYFYLQPGILGKTVHEFRPGAVFHLRGASVDQEIYGVPDYLASLQSALLNESATLFRRRYYNNGAHAGFLLYSSDATMPQKTVDAIADSLDSVRGKGNFKNVFVHVPSGDPEKIKLISFNEQSAKDEFLNVKDVSRDDVLAAHRMPPVLLGIVPKNAGGFGKITEAADVYHETAIAPVMEAMAAFNEWAGEEVIRFRPYTPNAGATTAP